MAAPHTKKKSTTTTSETVTRNGHNEHRKRVIEEFEEGDDDDEMQDAEELDSQENSQQSEAAGPPDNGLAELIGKMVDTRRKRLHISKKDIYENYHLSKTETQDSITTLFDTHEAKASAAHDAQLTMLRQLLAHKATLEAKMSAKLTQLEASYVEHCSYLQRVAEHRVKALK